MDKRFKVLFCLGMFIIAVCSNAISMETPAKLECKQLYQLKQSSLDIFNKDIQVHILLFVTGNIGMGNTLSQAIAGVKRFYIACPKSRESVDIMKTLLSWLTFKNGKELQHAVDKLEELEYFPVFKNSSMQKWIKQKKHQLDDESELLNAAFQLDVKKVTASISKGVNINAVGSCGRTPLFFALMNGHYPTLTHDLNKLTEIVPALIKAGADINTKTIYGSIILGLPSYGGHPAIVQMLLKAGANPNSEEHDGETPLTMALFRLSRQDVSDKLNHMKVLRLLLEAGANPNARGKNGSVKEIIEKGPGLIEEQKTELIQLFRDYGLNE